MAETLISVIIPTYNEAATVGDVVRSIRELNLPRCEVLVINDGSSDTTAEQAEAAGARVISHPYNIGNGAAVKTGIRSAKGDVLVFLDADGQHQPKDIPYLLKHLTRYHMVVGARQRGSETHWHRRIANRAYNILASFVAQFPIQDLTSGFRAMRRQDAVRFCDMFPNQFSYPTTSTLAFIRSGRSIHYVPIHTRFRVGQSKIRLMRDGFQFLVIIMKIAMTFSPLRIFMPVSAALFMLGFSRYIYTYLTEHTFTNMSHLLINSSVIILLLGFIAEQIAAIRFERGDRLFEREDTSRYAELDSLVAQEPPTAQATH